MADKEERLLQQNVEEITERAGSVQDMDIYQAMRSGIAEGKKREQKRKYSYGITAAAAAIIAAPIAFSYADNPQSREAGLLVQSSAVKVWKDSGLFKSGHFSDPALVNALEGNLIKPIYISAEKKGIRVEVLGAVTDGRKAFILYNVQNHSDEAVDHAGFTLDYGTVKAPSIGTSLEMAATSNVIGAGQTVSFVYMTTLLPSVAYPKSVNYNVTFTETSEKALLSSSNKYRTSLSIPFELDSDMFKKQTKQVTVNRPLNVDGQKIMVNQILYTPLATYLDLAYDEKNSKQIFQLLNPVLIGKTGNTTLKMYYPGTITSKNSEVYTDNNRSTLVFSTTPSKPFDTASLKIAGIAALDKKQMSITVDLNKKEIIAAPDKTLTLTEPGGKMDAGQILFSRTIKKSPSLSSFTMALANSFTDAEGAVHPISGDNDYSSRTTSDESIMEGYAVSFGKKALDYPQPLTIAIERYWNPILESQTLELHSK